MIGGFELAALNLSTALRERGHEVSILTAPTFDLVPDQESWVERSLALRDRYFLNVPIEDSGARRQLQFDSQVSAPDNSLIVLDRIRRFQPDHVMTFNLLGLGGLGILDTIRRTGVPVTMNLGDDVPGQLLQDVPGPVRDVYDAVPGGLFEWARYAIVSRTLAREAERSIPLGERRYIARGVRYPDVARTREWRADGTTRFIYVGILASHKGVDLILDAAERLRNSGHDGFTVDFYGNGDLATMRSLAEARGLSERLRFHGRVSQRAVAEAASTSDALVFPTWHREPGASVPGEAAAVGCLPIMTGDCGPSEWLVGGVHALKIERDADDLATAMRRVIDGEVDLASFAAAARRLVRGPLSFGHSVTTLESWIAEGTAPTGPRRFDYAAIASEVSRLDGDARIAWNRIEQERAALANYDPVTAGIATRHRSLWHRTWARLLRPIVNEEIAVARAALEARARAVDARESELDARDARVEHLLNTLGADILATNLRIDSLEEEA